MRNHLRIQIKRTEDKKTTKETIENTALTLALMEVMSSLFRVKKMTQIYSILFFLSALLFQVFI